MEPLRAAARSAIRALGHDPVMAEDFGARATSPQVACMEGVRQSAAIVLILGEKYGVTQDSGISATHEEYREARERLPVLAFVQEGVDREPAEAAFVQEVQSWSKGLFRGGFRTTEELQEKVILALHEWQMANAAGPVDTDALVRTALAMMPEHERNRSSRGAAIVLAIAVGPLQPLLRPTEIEAPAFSDELLQKALFGPLKLFDVKRGADHQIDDHALLLSQGEEVTVRLEPQGSLRIQLPLPQNREGIGFSVIIEEEVKALLEKAFAYSGWLIDRIDSTHRLTHVALAVTIAGGDGMTWRTHAQQARSPNSRSMKMWGSDPKPVTLSPAVRPRAALKSDGDRLIEDLITLLRREWVTE